MLKWQIEVRKARGKQIVEQKRRKITQEGDDWHVTKTNSDKSFYTVKLYQEPPSCTCPDYKDTGEKCKHIYAVQYLNGDAESEPAPGTPLRKTYSQKWSPYNAAQSNEQHEFMPLLYDLCQTIEEREHRRGRKPTPYSAAVFAAVMKVYSTKSTRRAVADLDLAYELGYLRKPVSFTTVWSYLEKPELLPILRKLIIASSKPLGAVETIFAVDSTNFPASRYVQWSEVKNRGQLEHDWSKLHLMCGVKTNIVTDAVILDRYAADVHQLPMLLNTTAQNFAVSALSADMIYNTVENQEAIAAVGATGYIPFKRRLTGASGGLWERAFHYYTYRQNEFRQHYHLRSNVESTMRMIKTKFGSYVRSKTEVAMANEVYCKVLCHNICCLIHSLYELEIAAELLDFKKNAAD